MMGKRSHPFFINLSMALSMTLISFMAQSQDITTEGRDFWFGFMQNNATPNQPVELKVFISAVDSTGGKITIPGMNWSKDFTVLANATTMILVPTNLAMPLSSGNKENKGIHIESGSNITVYALNSRAFSADAAVILPTPALGKTYYITSYMGTPPSLFSEFVLVAAEEGTEIEITPSATTTDRHAAGIPYKVTLGSGQLMQVQSLSDLTGTKVTASGSCKNFAVFSGNEWTNVGNCGAAQDHLYEQLFPVTAWGKNFATVPYLGRTGGDIFTITASENATTVTISGQPPIILGKGKSATQLLSTPKLIQADKPIQIAQLSRSQSCDNQAGDPFMIVLSPLEQPLKKITFNAFNVTIIQNYYVNIVTPTAAINDLTLDGTSRAGLFLPIVANSDYSYAKINISSGNHTIISTSGFSAYVYGFGNIESFGYAVGAKLDNLNMIISSVKKSTGEHTTTVCAGDVVQFDVVTNKNFSQYQWNLNGQTKTGKQVEYAFANAGTYFVIVIGSTEADNCSESEAATLRMVVVKPNEKIKGPSSVCPFTPGVTYFVTADLDNTYKWFVEGGSFPAKSTKGNVIIDWGNTNAKARVRLITTDKRGCIGDTTALPVKINVKLEPILPIGLDSLCSSEIANVPYMVYLNPTSIYKWSISNGQIISGQGKNEINVSLNGPGMSSLSYVEESTLNDVCSGKSETLQIFIEQEPNELLDIMLPKKVFQLQEPIQFEFKGDPRYHFKSWNFGNGETVDSIKIDSPVKYLYKCPGDITVSASAYTSTVCQNTGKGAATITILAPQLIIQAVSHHTEKDSTLEVLMETKNVDFYTDPIQLQRRTIDPKTSNWVTLVKNQRSGKFSDRNLVTSGNVYEYRMLIPDLCKKEYESLPHNSILLMAEKDSVEDVETVNLAYNSYKNWPHGVLRYELWQKVDDGEYVLVSNMQTLKHTIDYNNVGFSYYFRTKAIENVGKQVSWSNTAYVEFVPKVKLYNVITPNNDKSNDVFVIDGIENYPNNLFTVFNRYGKTVFTASGYHNTWAGTDSEGAELSTGVYFYSLDLNDARPKEKLYKGSVSIVK